MRKRLIEWLVSKGIFCPAVLLTAVLVAVPVQVAYSQKSTCDFQHRECFTEQGYTACYNKIDIQKYYEFTDKGETALAEQLVSDDKRCVKLKGNEKAFMVDKSAGYVRFGIRGQDKTYWAKREALFAR
jgi:hypothetical protein